MRCAEGEVTLKSSGRKAGYAQVYAEDTAHVDSSGNGTVIIFIPGTPGCRLFNPLTACATPQLHGSRLIILDRPGIGRSSAPEPGSGKSGKLPHPHTDFVTFLGEFCEALGLLHVGLIGYSAGTPYALAASHYWQSHHWKDLGRAANGGDGSSAKSNTEAGSTSGVGLVYSCALISVISPPFPDISNNMSCFFQFGYMATKRMKWAVKMILKKQAAQAQKDPKKALQDGFKQYTKACRADAAALARPEVESLFLTSLKETVGKAQWQNALRETVAVAKPWPFDIADISVPVGIWQGQQDVGTTPAMAQHLWEHLPYAVCKIVPDAGHLLLFDIFSTEVIPWVLEQRGSAPT